MQRGHSESHDPSENREPSAVGFDRQVRQVVTMLLKSGPPDVHLVASAVRTSTRTLQRRLRRAGLTYAGVLQEVRCRAAEQMLANPSRKIGDVARVLGYWILRTSRAPSSAGPASRPRTSAGADGPATTASRAGIVPGLKGSGSGPSGLSAAVDIYAARNEG